MTERLATAADKCDDSRVATDVAQDIAQGVPAHSGPPDESKGFLTTRTLFLIAVAIFYWSVARFLLAWLTTWPISCLEELALILVIWIGGGLLFITLLGAVVELFERPLRRPFGKTLLWLGPCPLLWWTTAALDGPSAAMRKATPVVLAIEAYVAKEGHPPADLVDLVPDYMESVPTMVTRTFAADYGVVKDSMQWEFTVSGGWGGVTGTYDACVYAPGVVVELGGVQPRGEWRCIHDD